MRSPARFFEALMAAIARRAGQFFFLCSVGLVAWGVAFGLTNPDPTNDAPAILSVALFLGLVMILASFANTARAGKGAKPTMPQLALIYAFGWALILVVARRIEQIFGLPDFALSAVRFPAYGMVFVLGWVLFYGVKRGWHRMRVEAWPLSLLFGSDKVPLSSPIEEEESDA